MMGLDFSGSSLGASIIWMVSLPIGLVISIIIYRYKKNRQIFYFLSAWFLWLIVTFIKTLNTENAEYLKLSHWAIVTLASIFFLFLSYRKTKSFWKTTGIILLNLAILSLAIFLLNR